MKWPSSITLVRHGQSTYNELRERKAKDPEYQKFRRFFELERSTEDTAELALKMQEKYALGVSDYMTPLSQGGMLQAKFTGERLREAGIPTPDVILVSPYLRARQTYDGMRLASNGFMTAPMVIEDRIREQEHGLSNLYNDWRIFHTLHPEQRAYHELMGPYWYQYPQGESVSMVRDRIRSFTATLIREYAGVHVMLVTHHLTILSIRASYERLSPEEFIHLDEHEKPVNCGVTLYRGNPALGSRGKLELTFYNKKLY